MLLLHIYLLENLLDEKIIPLLCIYRDIYISLGREYLPACFSDFLALPIEQGFKKDLR